MAASSNVAFKNTEKVSLWIELALLLVKLSVIIYKFLSWPYWALVVKPRRQRRANVAVKARPTTIGDPSTPWRCLESYDSLLKTCFSSCETIDDLFYRSVSLCPDAAALGTRELINEEYEVQKDGRKFKKSEYGKYYWETFKQIENRAFAFGRGLTRLGQKPYQNILIFSETRAEWIISAYTAFCFNFPIVTLYATLGDEAIIHGINEAEVNIVITSDELLAKVIRLLPRLPTVKHVIYLDHGVFRNTGKKASTVDVSTIIKPGDSDVKIHSMESIEELGNNVKDKDPRASPSKPKPTDLAVIMYTSGSTSLPKGVEITHGSLLANLSAIILRIGPLNSNDVYIGYLPLAHVLELNAELLVLACSIKIGYSSPTTLNDNSSKIKRHTAGDASVLKPTIMATVPVIIDRMYKAVWERVNEMGPFTRSLFNWAYDYKTYRIERGYPTPILDMVLYKKIRSLVGGRLRLMLCGGAPLSPDSQRFINIVFCRIVTGYGLTETCGGAAVGMIGDPRASRNGPPLACSEILLRPWKEGGYSPHDKPFARGEVLVSGHNVARGYYKQPEKTAEDFIFDSAGKRWFCTGNEDDLEFNEVCENAQIKAAVLKQVEQAAIENKLEKFEIPQAVYLSPIPWVPDNGLVTDAFKLKRREIQNRYQKEIDTMYEELSKKGL